MINKIIEYSVKNRIVIIISAVILLGIGYKIYIELPVDVYPDLNAPIVTVVTENRGMSPEDIETLITFPLESSFNSLPYVKRVRSNSALGISIIKIEFEYETNIYFARQLVSEKLQMINSILPENTKVPFIGPISSMFADAIEFTIKSNDLFEARDFAEWTLKPRLQTVRGVSNVINFGGYLKQYQVLLDPNEMLNYDITVQDVVSALKENNITSSGGYLLNGSEEKLIRGMGRIETIEDIDNIVLKENKGVVIYIKNVADVQIGATIRRGSAGESGREVVAVTVQSQYNSNVLNTIEGVEQVLADIKEKVKDRFTLETFYTQLNMIMKSIQNVSRAIYIGAFLVVLVLYLFLNNIRSTLVISMSIPLSAIIAFIFFRLFNLSINIMTLGGLAIGLGMIVDSSIIMAENIYRHVHEDDTDFKTALLTGAKEVGRPIFYAVLILLAVFAPIFTLHGIEGKMFIPLTFAVSAAVLGSLIFSLTMTPVLSSYLYRRNKIQSSESFLVKTLKKYYYPLLKHSIRRPKFLVGICLALVAAGVFLSFRIGSEFMPEMDESSLIMNVLLPPETSLEESGRIASIISQKVAELPEVERVVRRTGRAEGTEHAEPVNLTESNVVLLPKEDRKKSIHKIKNDIRHQIEGIPGVSIILTPPLQHRINHAATGTVAAIAIKIFGENLNSAYEIAEKVFAFMEDIAGVTDQRIEQLAGVPQLKIIFDRKQIARYGLNIKDISDLIEIALNGQTATDLIETQKRYDIFVRYQEDFRDNESKIENMIVKTPAGYRLPLSEFATIVTEKNPAIIRRENTLRRVMVQCNVSGRDIGSVVSELKEKISSLEMPDGYFITFGGTYESQIRAMRQLSVVVLLTIAIVFTLLVFSFRSYKQALLILLNIPLALVGGVIIIFITGNTLSVPSIVGFIALIGIAVQDGIVLISHINRYRIKGLLVEEAVLKAANNKIRPVLMTTFTTMLGLLPLALRNATGSEIQKPLAFMIMFGLLFSTALTLIVLPTLYTAMEKDK